MARVETIRTTLGPLDAVWILVAAVAGGWGGNPGIGLLCGIAMGGAIGAWRLVRIQAKLLEIGQAEHFGEDQI